jgi:mono/diheme cytochrome c family protein
LAALIRITLQSHHHHPQNSFDSQTMERHVNRISALANRCSFSSRWLRVIALATFPVVTAIAVAFPAPHLQEHPTQTDNKGRQASTADIHHGELIFTQQHCDRCHGLHGEGVAAAGQHGRGSTQIASTTLGLPDFIRLVRKPAGSMPAYSPHDVSDLELSDVYAFLQSSTPPSEPSTPAVASVTNGQRLYVSYGCAECHLSQGQGARSTQGSRLGPPQLPLSSFISYVRQPTREMPPYTRKVLSDAQLQDIYAFLETVPKPSPWRDIPLLNQ